MTLHVESSGSGHDLFLIHGWGMHGGVWHGVVDALAQRFRVHALDLPGMGHSPRRAPVALASLAAQLAEHIPEQSTVCGWSLGGQVAMRLALDDPDKVARLLLVGTTPRFVSGADWDCGVDAAVFNQFAAQVEADYPVTMGRFLGLQAFGGEASRELIRLLRERFAQRPPPDREALREALQILLTTDLRAELVRLRQPVLLVHGDRDTLAPVGAARWMAGQMPQARLEVIAGASHAPFISHPSLFLQAVTDFLE